jgi:hypothetical protein
LNLDRSSSIAFSESSLFHIHDSLSGRR